MKPHRPTENTGSKNSSGQEEDKHASSDRPAIPLEIRSQAPAQPRSHATTKLPAQTSSHAAAKPPAQPSFYAASQDPARTSSDATPEYPPQYYVNKPGSVLNMWPLPDEDRSTMNEEEKHEYEELLEGRLEFIKSYNGRDPDEVLDEERRQVELEFDRLWDSAVSSSPMVSGFQSVAVFRFVVSGF